MIRFTEFNSPPKNSMKTRPLWRFTILLTLWAAATSGFAQISAFTYQGQLNVGGVPANGLYDFNFRLLNDPTNGVAAPVIPINLAVPVTNGIFTTGLDFGAENFDGANLWLEINVRTNGGGAFTTLSPRQLLTSTPYAVRALSASNLLGTLPASQLSGAIPNASLPTSPSFSGTVGANSFSGDGASVSNVNAATLGGLSSSNIWKLGGNAGTTPGAQFIGTSDNQSLEFKVNNTRAMRFEPNSSGAPNVIGGSPRNFVESGSVGATIAGGGTTNYLGFSYTNSVSASFGTIGGGVQNTIQNGAIGSTIGGGWQNTIQSNAQFSTIGGGDFNTIQTNAVSSTIGGGDFNTIQTNAQFSTIGGGVRNTIQPGASFSTIGGGVQNTIQTNALYSTIGGGEWNTIQTNALFSTIGGGAQNTIQTNAWFATIPGGIHNSATHYAFAAGRRAKANHTGAFVWGDSTDADFASTGVNQFCLRASGGVRLSGNTSVSFGSTLSQKLNLYDTTFGIGIQSGVQYSRVATGGGFGWFAGGVHNDTTFNAGGGTVLMTLTSGGLTVNGTFVSASDRNAKEQFEPLNPREVLDKVVALPLSKWSYKQDSATRHLGPMAQDFHAAFGVGPDDKHIATVDADGVALAAIQGLNQKLEEQRAENVKLKHRLEKLEQLMNLKAK
jgi:hypothetical protein